MDEEQGYSETPLREARAATDSRQPRVNVDVETEKRGTCIIGMHCSGTSLIARLANLLGVYLGPEEQLFRASLDNPIGSWEHQGIVDLNNRIFANFGGSYFQPPQLPSGWEKSPELADLRDHARRIISDNFNAVANWGWSDPRTCLTLSFWQELLPSLRYVLCFRNPVDLASSFAKRDGISFENAIELWLGHVSELLSATKDRSRFIVFYEDIILDWRNHFKQLGKFLNGPEFEPSNKAYLQAAPFIEKELQKYSTSFMEVMSEPRLPFEAKALYIGLKLFTTHSADQELHQWLSQEFIEQVAVHASSSLQRRKQAEAEISRVGQRNQELQTALEGANQVHADLQRKVKELESSVTEKRARISTLSNVNSALEESRVVFERQICDLKLARNEHLRVITELRQSLNAVEVSLAWKLVGRVRAAKDSLIPKGTTRRRLYDLALRTLKNSAIRNSH